MRREIEAFKLAYEWRGLPQQKTEKLGGGDGATFHTKYLAYDNAGNLTSMCYPSGQTVGYGFNDGGLLDAVTAGGSEVFSGIRYAPHGAPYAAVLGNTATGRTDWAQSFNARLWPKAMVTGPGVTPATDPANPNDPHFNAVLFGLKYTAYENNGNIGHVDRCLRQTSGAAAGTLAFTYGYDNLNRLLSAGFDLTPATGQVMSGTYGYDMDEFGNLRAENRTAGSGNNLLSGHAMPVNANTNRLLGRTYDILGNMTDLDVNGQTQNLTYLDQGHVYELKQNDTVTYRYYYDAEGKRRAKAKAVSGVVNLADNCSFFFYSGEDLICQKDLGAEVIPDSDSPEKVNGAYYQPKFLLTDHLGTTRAELMFDPATLQPKLNKTYDTMPYGELISVPTGRAEPVLFSGKLRDNESGLDYFGARYYGNTLGRWISPDKVQNENHIKNTQTWNLYSYALGNPLIFIDPNGKEVQVYGETLPSGNYSKDVKGFCDAHVRVAVAIANPRHSYLRVKTDKLDIVLELGGPPKDHSSKKGIPQRNDVPDGKLSERPGQAQGEVTRPYGVGEKDYSFENKILDVFNTITKNLPDYHADGPNSNGFIKLLVEAAGGGVDLPSRAFVSWDNKINEYWQKYKEQLEKDGNQEELEKLKVLDRDTNPTLEKKPEEKK